RLSTRHDDIVNSPQVGKKKKSNHTHTNGGKRGKIDTVEKTLNIPNDYYVRMNCEAFMDVVDALDGISVDVPYEFKEQDSTDKADAIHLYPGYQELNGEEALALARTRKMDTDVDRGKRQQEIIEALVSKTISVKSILKYDDIIEAIGKNMKTNMTFTEMKSFFSYATHGSNLDIETLNIDGYDYQPNRTYFWKFDEEDLAEKIKILQEHLEIPVTDSDEENIEGNEQQEEQGEYNNEQEPNYEEEPYEEDSYGEEQNQEQDPYGEEQNQEQYQEQYQEQNPYGEDNY